jgi:hypothetical protein
MPNSLHEHRHPTANEINPVLGETISLDDVAKVIIDTHRELYSRSNRSNIGRADLMGKILPVTPLPHGPEVSAEDRQRIALNDLEFYQGVIADPSLKSLGDEMTPTFVGHSWTREETEGSPVYTEVAMLSPNIALSLSFDLDDNGYATDTKARLLLSKKDDVLYEHIRGAIEPTQSPNVQLAA